MLKEKFPIIIENRTGEEIKAKIILEEEYFSGNLVNLVIGGAKTLPTDEPKILRLRIILEKGD